MRVVVLAAGFGTRLGRLGEECAKALLEVAGRPAIESCAAAAEALEAVEQVDVVTNARFHAAFEAWRSARRGGKPVRLWNDGARDPSERLGAIGDLAHWLARARPAGPALVLGADNVFDGSLAPLAARAHTEPAVALVDVGSAERVSRLASVELDEASRVVRFVEKDPAPRTTLACAALYALSADALADVPRYLAEGGAPDNLGYFVEWLHRRRTVRGVVLAGRWVDIGSPEDYARALRLFGDEPQDPRGPGLDGPGAGS
jgi:CDP-L-myo-inositol myo-inositolphosphotransferase